MCNYRLDCEHLYWEKQHLLFGMMRRIVCQCWGWQIKKLSSNTVSKFFALQMGKQHWHSSPWLMNMAENHVSSGSNIITDNNNYAINISLATWNNRGKQDFCEQWAFQQPAVGKLPQVPDRWSHLLSYHTHQTFCVCPPQIYNNPTAETVDI